MARKIQLPAIGGIRKVIKTGDDRAQSINPGTTIAEFANQRITLAQLRAALGLSPQILDPGPSGGTVSSALIVGPGLSGGGAMVGAVPLNLTIPLPLIPEDTSAEDYVPIPGPQGFAGPQGPPGLTAFAEAEQEDAILAPPIATLPRKIISATWLNPGSPNVIFVYVPNACSIMAVRLMTAGGAGSCVVDIWKDAFGSFPPVVGDSITAAAKPTISSGVTYVDTTLTGWTRNINAGDVLAFNLDSSSTFTQIDVALEVQE